MGKKPSWYKGQMRECSICGFWYPERDFRISKDGSNWVCKKDQDSLSDIERESSINRR